MKTVGFLKVKYYASLQQASLLQLTQPLTGQIPIIKDPGERDLNNLRSHVHAMNTFYTPLYREKSGSCKGRHCFSNVSVESKNYA